MYFHIMINYIVYFMLGFLSCLVFIELIRRYNNLKGNK